MAGDTAATDISLRAPQRHRLNSSDVDALVTGRSTAGTVGALVAAERSWRLVQLRVLLDAVRGRRDAHGPLAPIEHAWELLARAQADAPAMVDAVLQHPPVGTWAAYTLRRLRGTTTSSTPLWVDVGYLHSLAAAAGLAAGITFTIDVPVRDGFVVLPTVGAARVPDSGPPASARITTCGTGATIHHHDAVVVIPNLTTTSPFWTPYTSVRAETDGHALAIDLDFLDPYRDFRAPSAPQPPSPERVRRWERLLDEAWRLLVHADPHVAPAMSRGLRTVTPVPAVERFRSMSASAGVAFGGLLASDPPDAVNLAVTLVHEFQHIKLGGLIHLSPLQHRVPAQRFYAPWRDDPRPLDGLLQGVYAFTGIAAFWHKLLANGDGAVRQFAAFEFCHRRHQIRRVLPVLGDLADLTDLGKRLVEGLTATAAGWSDDQVPPWLDAVALRVAEDHQIRWRLHHLRPDPSRVEAAVRAWIAGRPAPTERGTPRLVPDPSVRLLDTAASLVMWRLVDPDTFFPVAHQPAAAAAVVTGATEADLALATDDLDAAGKLARTAIGTGMDQPGVWAVLRHTVADPGAAEALARVPEFVRAVYQRVHDRVGAPPDPVTLARWITTSER